MNNKGFALSGMLYTILAIFVLLVVGLLTMFNSRKTILDKLKKKVLDETSNIYEIYNFKTAGKYEINITKTGYYEIEIANSIFVNQVRTVVKGLVFTGKIYLEKDTKLYAEVNSCINYHSNSVTNCTSSSNHAVIEGYFFYVNPTETGVYYFDEVTKTNKNLVKSGSLGSPKTATTSAITQDKYNEINFENIEKTELDTTSRLGSVKVTYIPEVRQNADLNKVKYIKDCITESTDPNYNSTTGLNLEGCYPDPDAFVNITLTKPRYSLLKMKTSDCIENGDIYECSNNEIVTNLRFDPTYQISSCKNCQFPMGMCDCYNNSTHKYVKERVYEVVTKSNVKYPTMVCKKKYFTEIEALVDSENKIDASKITGDINPGEESKLVDGDLNSKVEAVTFDSNGKSCITAELNNVYNLDSITVWHNTDNRKYVGRTLSVSSDGVNYRVIDNYEKPETINGLTVKANEISKVKKIGNVYVPIKKHTDGSVWMRIYHHNNLYGKIFWDAKTQVLLDGGLDTLYKKSILYYMKENDNNLKFNGKYEFMLEYPDDFPGKYRRWNQTSNFTKTSTIAGYKNISFNFEDPLNGVNGQDVMDFGGLVSTGTSITPLAASASTTGGDRYYHIGATQPNNYGVIGPYAIGQYSIKKTTDLWVRIE